MKEHVFGVEKGHGDEIVSWINEQIDSTDLKLKIKLIAFSDRLHLSIGHRVELNET